MPLTQQQINFIAQKAQWYIEVDNRRAVDGGDTYTVTGDGIDDLDRFLAIAPTMPLARYQIDVGTQYSDYRPFDLNDARAIRTAYIEFFGTVNKPSFPVQYPQNRQVSISSVQMGVQQ